MSEDRVHRPIARIGGLHDRPADVPYYDTLEAARDEARRRRPRRPARKQAPSPDAIETMRRVPDPRQLRGTRVDELA
jgi:hypothetical protein